MSKRVKEQKERGEGRSLAALCKGGVLHPRPGGSGEGRALVAPALQRRRAFARYRAMARRRVPVDRIFSAPADNFRADRDAAAFGELVQSMAEVGQLMPIQLHPATDGEDQFDLVFGCRRLAAARNLGWTEILADCHPQRLDPREVYRLRAVENLQRENLSPLEEATAVYALLAEVTGIKRFAPAEIDAERSVDLKPESIREVATLIGKSEAWVRDRAILVRLSPKVREAVGRGLLPLGHARELAKLADPKDQDDLLGAFERREDGSGGSDIEKCRRLVAERMRTLKGTRFRLDIPFAGHAACLDCPHNSARAMALFTTGGKTELEEARCLDGACWAEKSESAERLLAKAVAEAEKRKSAATPLGLSPIMPEGLKTAALIREVKKRRGELPAGKAETGNGERGTGNAAERKRNAAIDEWHEIATRAVLKKALKHPESLAALQLGCEFYDMFNKWEGREATADTLLKAEPILDLIGKTDEKTIPDMTRRLFAVYGLAQRLARETTGMPEWLCSLHPALVAEIAKRWQIKLPPIPGSQAEAAAPDVRKVKAPKPKGKAKAKARVQ